MLQERLDHTEQRLENERYELIDQIAEVHQAEADLKALQLKRMSERNAKLTRQLIREQAIVRVKVISIQLCIEREHSRENRL